jgi:hypothetical protein
VLFDVDRASSYSATGITWPVRDMTMFSSAALCRCSSD